jgi:hypothetical protein
MDMPGTTWVRITLVPSSRAQSGKPPRWLLARWKRKDKYMKEEEIIAMMLEVDRLKAALREIAEFDASDENGYVDEWEEAAAFTKCQDIAKNALERKG